MLRSRKHIFGVYPFFALRLAISQAGITARTLPLMQGSEEKE